MNDVMNIDGTEYIRKGAGIDMDTAGWEHVCVIADRGWIFEGRRCPDVPEDLGGTVELADAHVVRTWDNGLGIGGLADPAHKDEYTLDELGVVAVYLHAVLVVIPLRW